MRECDDDKATHKQLRLIVHCFLLHWRFHTTTFTTAVLFPSTFYRAIIWIETNFSGWKVDVLVPLPTTSANGT